MWIIHTDVDHLRGCLFQNERYLELTAKLLDGRTAAAAAKREKKKKDQKALSLIIRQYIQGGSRL